jgi:ADP-ribose pyrophosphatase YjhB (NUDIX family)
MQQATDKQPRAEFTPWRILIVAGALVVRNGEILFVRQTYPPFERLWGFPTGLPDPGELVDAAALRETREEAGIEAEIEGLIGVHNAGGDDGFFYVVYLCHHVGGEPVPDGVENDRAAYLSPSGLEVLGDERIIPPCAEMARRFWAGDYHLLLPWDNAPTCFGPLQSAFW